MNIMVSINVSIIVIIMVRKILTKNSFKSGNGLVISPLSRDFFLRFYLKLRRDVLINFALIKQKECL